MSIFHFLSEYGLAIVGTLFIAILAGVAAGLLFDLVFKGKSK